MLVAQFNEHLMKIRLPEQAGFMSNQGCVDATAALKIMLQNLTTTGHEAYVLFVDLVKAFNSVNWEMLWDILLHYGIPPQTVKTIKKMYTNINIKATVGNASKKYK